ncbi:copper resistance system multicopper oxidase [Oleiagrimonas soli]|uniref:CopA family copper-resistance protein n=1 Tax=Oleiagrimonas soli TaxID=1543381 RepID=A0A099CW59_9GAMM|nr:copper resistance system multicopper oxidase [Oleiagrimonas soli]KGI77872.1 copper resistance protein CopA [Oleiagrimonas soli]MBB6183776.1 CopA family copper-resistance protein [Oleiagrimonas soli]
MSDFRQRPPAAALTRRRFVQGLALGGAAAGLGLLRAPRAMAAAKPYGLAQLRGTRFALDIGELPVDYTGRARIATAINGSVPGPLLRWKQGDTVTIQVRNRLRVPTSIHWHGILLPADMDGVPGLSFPGIAPGETFTYRFKLRQSGTYWYHSHSGFQEQTGLYGPLVVEPEGGERHPTERDYVVMLNDWTDEDPWSIFATLKKHSDFYNFAEPTAPEFLRDMKRLGLQQALAKRKMWNRMRMSPADLSDVTGYTYTYLMNGHTPNGNWTGLFSRGEKVRLRFINGSAMSFFDVRIPGLKMTVVAADGQDVEPVSVDEFRIAVAETYDVIVEPSDDRAYTIFAQSMDRTGYARGTLAPRTGMQAEVPAMDPRAQLAMVDMMGAMAMPGGMHDGHAMHGMSMPADPPAHHARTEYGPGVDMRVDHPRDNIDDPGIGLRGNGRKVLTYADLHTLGGPVDTREPGRDIELHLTGNMERYMWSFDGQKFADAKPLHFRYGEHLRVTLVNDTMMTHPIHLHGMWSELEAPDGSFQVRKHTISVQPAQRVRYRVSADALGRWAYHCHLLYHMEAGMFREVVVS